MDKLDPSVAVPILLIADSDVRRRGELRRFFSSSGFLVVAAADGLGCLAELGAMETDVLVIALEIPWGGGDGVIAQLNEGLPVRRKPLLEKKPRSSPRRRTSLSATSSIGTATLGSGFSIGFPSWW